MYKHSESLQISKLTASVFTERVKSECFSEANPQMFKGVKIMSASRLTQFIPGEISPSTYSIAGWVCRKDLGHYADSVSYSSRQSTEDLCVVLLEA